MIRRALPTTRSQCRGGVTFHDDEIVDVNLPLLPLELVEHIGGEAAHNLILGRSDDRNEMNSSQELSKTGVAGNGALVGLHLAEGLPKHAKQRFELGDVGAVHAPDGEGGRWRHRNSCGVDKLSICARICTASAGVLASAIARSKAMRASSARPSSFRKAPRAP